MIKWFAAGSLALCVALAFIKPAAADAEASKLNSFPILQPTGPEAAKLNSFPILQPTGPEAAKLNSFPILQPTGPEATTLISYVVISGRPAGGAIFGAPF